MVTFPHRGNGLHLRCLACRREVWLGGRDLVTRFTDWLDRPLGAWAAGLKCHDCGSRRVTVGAKNDPGASGFFVSTMDSGPTIWDRRLASWLAEVGRDIEDYRPILPK